jgi:hypothetical protein
MPASLDDRNRKVWEFGQDPVYVEAKQLRESLPWVVGYVRYRSNRCLVVC